MNYKNLNQIKKDFNISDDDIKEVRKELIKIKAKLHPDKNSGKFKTKDDENRYHKVGEAIQFIDEEKSNYTLIPLKEVNSLINTIKELIPSDKENILLKQEHQLSEKIESGIKNVKSRHLLPKVSVTAVSAILSIIWLFPSQISEHPVLSKFIDINSIWFTVVWFYSLMTTGALWLYFAFSENKDKQFKSLLKIEAFQDEIFKEFIGFKKHQSREGDFNFTKSEFIDFIRFEVPDRNNPEGLKIARYINRFRNLDLELAQSLSETILIRAENKECIKKDNRKSLSDVYLLSKDFEY